MSTDHKMIAISSVDSESIDSEIAAEQARVDRLNESAKRWNKWYVRALFSSLIVGGLSLIIAGVTVAFQKFAITDSMKLSDRQNILLHLKDIKATADSRGKDQKIADTNKLAGDANKDAGKANERAANLELMAANLKKQNLDTESQLEKERNQRQELEKSIGWRWLTKYGKEDVEPLRKFAGVHVAISCPSEPEPQIAANQLADLLHSVGWIVDSFNPMLTIGNVELFDGVILSPVRWRIPNSMSAASDVAAQEARAQQFFRLTAPSTLADDASSALGDLLKANDWSFRKETAWAETSGTAKDDPPLATIRIWVARKPNTYFLSDDLKKTLAEYRRITDEELQREKNWKHERDEIRRQLDEQDRERDERIREIIKERAKPPLVLRPPEEPEKPKE